MSDEQQGPPRGEPSDSHRGEQAPTEWMGSGDPPRDGHGHETEPEPTGGSGGRRRLVAVGAIVVALALVGGGAVFAFQVMGGAGPQPADAIPSSAIAYARIDLDPSAEQKVNAVRLLRSVPQFEEVTGITSDTDDLRKRLFEEALRDDESCRDIDYDDDIAPWIGDRAGVAALPANEGEEPDAVLVLQVSDQDAARDGLEALEDCGVSAETDEPDGIAFVGEYAVLAESQDKAEEFAAAAEAEPLSASESFIADMAALDGEGLLSFWVDLDAVVAAAGQSDSEMAPLLESVGSEELGSVSAAVRARPDALELVYAGSSELLMLNKGATAPAGDVQALPASTLLALGFTGGSDSVDLAWERLQELEGGPLGPEFRPGALEDFAGQLEAETGFVIPEDVGVLLGDEFTLAVDGTSFDLPGQTGQPDLSTINVGARLRTDAEAANDVISRVQELLAQGGAPLELAQQEVEGGLVVAANEGYADTLAEEGVLGDSEVFEAAVADKDDAVSVLFLDIDKVDELVDRIAGDLDQELPPERADTLEALRALGVSTTVDDDYSRTTIRLVFD